MGRWSNPLAWRVRQCVGHSDELSYAGLERFRWQRGCALMRWAACTLVCAALVSTSARAMDLLDQWQSPGDVRYAIIGPEGDGGRSGLVVSSADVQVHGPRGASMR